MTRYLPATKNRSPSARSGRDGPKAGFAATRPQTSSIRSRTRSAKRPLTADFWLFFQQAPAGLRLDRCNGLKTAWPARDALGPELLKVLTLMLQEAAPLLPFPQGLPDHFAAGGVFAALDGLVDHGRHFRCQSYADLGYRRHGITLIHALG